LPQERVRIHSISFTLLQPQEDYYKRKGKMEINWKIINNSHKGSHPILLRNFIEENLPFSI
jgi:hypothetical protein